ncbi:MAG: hypothetical protein BWY72_02489 [Bacteroidetes bacterium ADurb.Bin416]|nr:MAG: hypothetical protein BWY72_02489 [Bacteroidetes bacterium ADurb.Bin416]
MIEGVSMKQTVYRKRYDLDHASRPAKSSVSTTG